MAKHQTSTSPTRSRAVLGALPIAATLVTMSAGSALGGTAFASEHHGGQDHHGQHSAGRGEQTAGLGQSSESSAPATQYAPAQNISFLDLGGKKDDGHGKRHGEHGKQHDGHGKHGKHGDGEHRGGQSVDNHADNDARATSGNSGGVHQQQRGGHGRGNATQTGSLSQGSSASAPASQYAPARNVSIVSFGGKQEIDNHPSNSASATSGNSGGVHQKQG